MKIMFRKAITVLFAVSMMLGASGLWMAGSSPAYASSGPSWVSIDSKAPLTQDVPQNVLSAPVMYVDNGTPYLAFRDPDHNYGITVMKYSGNYWHAVGCPGFAGSPLGTGPINLIVDNGTPYVSYVDNGKVLVQNYNGNSNVECNSSNNDNNGWNTLLDTSNLPISAENAAMAINNGTIYVAYSYPSGSTQSTIYVVKYTDAGWQEVGALDTGYSSVKFSFAVDKNGTPYVAYFQFSLGPVDHKLTIQKFIGSGWNQVGDSITNTGTIFDYSMAIDGSGIPYIDYTNSSFNGFDSFVLKYTSGAWSTLSNPDLNTVGGLSPLFIDGDTPYLAYTKALDITHYSLHLASYNGTAWSSQDIITAGLINYPVVSVSGGNPYVGYLGEIIQKPTVMEYTWADRTKNTVSASPGTVEEGASVTLAAYGHRQLEAGETVGEEQYVPVSWTADEPDKSGNFQSNGTDYTSIYTPATGGTRTVTATFQKQKWNGTGWVDAGQTDTKTASVTMNVPPTYTIAPIANKTELPVVHGYLSAPTITVDVTRTGTGDLANLSAVLSDGDTGSFDLTQPSIQTLDNSHPTTSFTVQAKAGLSAGTYTATVAVKADNMDDMTFTVTQRVDEEPTYTIGGIADKTAPALNIGYTSGSQQSVTVDVYTTGSGDLSGLAVALSGDDADSFELTLPLNTTLDRNNQATSFTVKAKDNLPIGTHTATVTISADNMEDVTFTVTQEVQGQLTYTIAPLSNQTLEPLDLGFTSGSQETKTINISRTGTANLINLATTLSGGDVSSFEITQPLTATLNSGTPGTSFTVKAKDGLPGGTYTATVKVSADNMDDVEFTVTQVVNNPSKGDINGDGLLTPADALYITKYVNNLIQLTDKELYILDMNDDGFVNAEDAKIIMQIYVGGNVG